MERKIKVVTILICFVIVYLTMGHLFEVFYFNHKKRDTIKEANTLMLQQALNEELKHRFIHLSKSIMNETIPNESIELIRPDIAMIDSVYKYFMHLKYPGMSLYTIVSGGTDISAGENEIRTEQFSLNDLSGRAIQGIAIPQPDNLWVLITAYLIGFPWFLLLVFTFLFVLHIIFRQRKDNRNLRLYIRHTGHQMRSPFSVLQTSLFLIDEDTTRDELLRYRQLIESNIRKLRRLFDNLELASGQDSIDLNCTEFDLMPVLLQIKNDFLINPPKKVEISIDNQLKPTEIYADRLHIGEVIHNLIDNAIKYSGSEARVEIRLFEEEHYICIAVRDNGQGISTRYQKKVFQRFFRINNSSSVKGFGLGLSYASKICAAHGGDITLNSNIETGCEFIIKIPSK
ncbi:MAG: HAMP domain-containing histidine kinase [Bacteroidales bacterium]|jgi:signal transduction histidine kinase|nr:HAMP domain-containing histidine kinase [Bacteroidales bacterium]